MSSPPRPAFDDVAARALPQLVRAADLMTEDAAAADDVVVDALVSVYRRWPGLTRRRDPLDDVRRALTAASVHRNRRHPNPTQPSLELADERHVERDPQPGDDRVWEALVDLAPRLRAVVVWRICEQLSDQRVARAVGLPMLVTRRLTARAVEQVGLTAGSAGFDEIGAGRDEEHVAEVESAIAASMASHRRDQYDVAALLDRVRARVADVAQRRSLRRPVLAAAAALTLLTVGGVVARSTDWSTDRDEPRADPAILTPPTPVAPEGTRLVGYRSLAVAVPSGWGRNLSGCGPGPLDTVIYPDAVVRSMDPRCRPGQAARASTVSFSESTSDLFGVAPSVIGEADGHTVLATDVRRRAGAYERAVMVPVVKFSMLVRSADLATLESVVTSVQRVPDGYAVVPTCTGLPVREAIGELGEAGLRVKLFQASTLSDRYGQPPVTRQSVLAGRLVLEGTVVGLGFPSTDQ